MAGPSKAAPLLPGPPPSPPPPWSPPLQDSSAAAAPPYEPWQSSSLSSSSAGGGAGLYPHSQWHKGDPRSSSSQSLTQTMHDGDERRILLIVYIHGFMGNNTSFRSFPAHVHSYLKDALVDSHVIHSKVYPRYKTYKAIEVARDNLSKWLEPHESERTDVVLVGHSMGGLLAADLALMPSPNPVYGGPFKHRILGTISLDAPLLGLHPGIIKSGLASLFRKAPDPPGKQQELAESQASQHASSSLSLDDRPSFSSDGAVSSGFTSPMPLTATSSNASGGPSQWSDPNFNPAFFNDVPFVDRGWWRNVAHFAKKHYSEGIFTSAYQHLLSHLEFGGCLADYSGLNNRYNRLRRLEDVDELNAGISSGRQEPRVRFVNYYTVSTGIPKTPPSAPPKRADTHLRPIASPSHQSSAGQSGASTPRISIEDYSDSERVQTLEVLDPVPMADSDTEEQPKPQESESVTNESGGDHGDHQVEVDPSAKDEGTSASELHTTDGDDLNNLENGLPAIPEPPEPLEAPDFERYTDKDARKQAEKEFKRVQKTYDQAVKNRDKAIKERQKLVEKRRKKAQKEAEKRQKEEDKRTAKEQQQKQKAEKAAAAAAAAERAALPTTDGGSQAETNNVTVSAATAADASSSSSSRAQVVTADQTQALDEQLTDLALQESSSSALPDHNSTTTDRGKQKDKKEKLHKFCMMPQKSDGVRDPTWVQVYMEGVDEVGAHCGLFFAGPHYEKLVGDVGGRVVGWVQEDLTKRAILAMG